jgi:hypothetical protein
MLTSIDGSFLVKIIQIQAKLEFEGRQMKDPTRTTPPNAPKAHTGMLTSIDGSFLVNIIITFIYY